MTAAGDKSTADDPAAIRLYAKEQATLAKDYDCSLLDPLFYRLVVHKGREVREACHAAELTADERQRQRFEAAKAALKASRDAKKKAKDIENQRI